MTKMVRKRLKSLRVEHHVWEHLMTLRARVNAIDEPPPSISQVIEWLMIRTSEWQRQEEEIKKLNSRLAEESEHRRKIIDRELAEIMRLERRADEKYGNTDVKRFAAALDQFVHEYFGKEE